MMPSKSQHANLLNIEDANETFFLEGQGVILEVLFLWRHDFKNGISKKQTLYVTCFAVTHLISHNLGFSLL